MQHVCMFFRMYWFPSQVDLPQSFLEGKNFQKPVLALSTLEKEKEILKKAETRDKKRLTVKDK